jgi:prohibitin 2
MIPSLLPSAGLPPHRLPPPSYSLLTHPTLSIPTSLTPPPATRVALAGGAVYYMATNSLFNVDGGHRAVVFNRFSGIKNDVYEEGTHFIIPWVERAIIYDVRAKPHVIQSTSGSRDLQMVNLSLRVLTRPYAGQLPEVYRRLGTDYAERVLPSIIHVSVCVHSDLCRMFYYEKTVKESRE